MATVLPVPFTVPMHTDPHVPFPTTLPTRSRWKGKQLDTLAAEPSSSRMDSCSQQTTSHAPFVYVASPSSCWSSAAAAGTEAPPVVAVLLILACRNRGRRRDQVVAERGWGRVHACARASMMDATGRAALPPTPRPASAHSFERVDRCLVSVTSCVSIEEGPVYEWRHIWNHRRARPLLVSEGALNSIPHTNPSNTAQRA